MDGSRTADFGLGFGTHDSNEEDDDDDDDEMTDYRGGSRGAFGLEVGVWGHLLWLKVYELSRLLSCCKRACIIPALLRDTGRV